MSTESSRNELEVRETFKVSSEFAPHVTMTEETFFSHGWQPLTITICQSLWFLPADATFDIPFLVDWYTRLGWKGANGQPLGEKVIRREIGLIREAGYVTMTRLRGEDGRAVGIEYSVSKRRSDQPPSGSWVPVIPGTEEIRRSVHMAPMATRGESPHVGIEEKPRSVHMAPMATRGESPHVVNGAKPQVSPHGTNGVTPPHPPEGGGNTTPSPHKKGRAGKWAEQCALHPADYVPTAEEIKTAQEFLQGLPGKWQMGVDDARDLATLLASRAHTQGRDLDVMLEVELMQDDPNNPARVPSRVMPTRIRNIRRLAPETRGTGGTTRRLADWCGECNRGERPAETFQRLIDLPDGRQAFCPQCHPKHTHAARS